MKKLFTLIIALLFTFNLNAQNIPNAGFENWESGNPSQWNTNNSANPGFVTQSSDANTGSFALRLNAVELIPTNFFSGFASTGFDFAQPFPPAIRFWAKGNLEAPNRLVVESGMTGSMGAATAESEFFNLNPNLYTQYYITYSPVFGTQGDTATIIIGMSNSGSGNILTSGNNLAIIDDISLGEPLGVNSLNEIKGNNFSFKLIQTYLSSDVLMLEFSIEKFSDVAIELYDLSGKNIRTLYQASLGAGNFRLEENLQSLPKGLYLCSMKTNEGFKTIKFVK